ncbi:Z-ring-associated protein, partial [Vibrio cholerae]
TNEVKLLTIAALNICYELQTKQQENAGTQSQLSERMEQLAASLEAALKNVKPGKQ